MSFLRNKFHTKATELQNEVGKISKREWLKEMGDANNIKYLCRGSQGREKKIRVCSRREENC